MIRMRKVEFGILKVKQLLVSGLWQLAAGCWMLVSLMREA